MVFNFLVFLHSPAALPMCTVVPRARSVRTNTKNYYRKPSCTEFPGTLRLFGGWNVLQSYCASTLPVALCKLAIEIPIKPKFAKCMISWDEDDGLPRMSRRRFTITEICSHQGASTIVLVVKRRSNWIFPRGQVRPYYQLETREFFHFIRMPVSHNEFLRSCMITG
ncbi:hypothetical protein EV702DRAFT_722653 [Suillus placidus]|uniref:Secreted protein n=1 Tax=Suillus placidus TaxID=48579 RepID=A0A9P7D6K7_9AGAM|nr:hypothetical protein EV702DRAFT_722653 [Suillus placidus]